MTAEEEDETGVDPAEFARAMLGISPEDAEKVRDATPATRKRGGKGQEGPTADHGLRNSAEKA